MMAVAVFLQEDVVLPVSAVGGGVGVLVVGVAWHVTVVAGHDCRLLLTFVVDDMYVQFTQLVWGGAGVDLRRVGPLILNIQQVASEGGAGK